MSRSFMQRIEELPRSRPMSMMAVQNGVLCYGHDVMLLHSRKWLLQHAGCPSDYVMTEAQYKISLQNAAPGVIVLCQSLSPDECAAACEVAGNLSPHSRLLLLFTRVPKCLPEQRHSSFNANDGPRLFSQTVFNLLYRNLTQSAQQQQGSPN